MAHVAGYLTFSPHVLISSSPHFPSPHPHSRLPSRTPPPSPISGRLLLRRLDPDPPPQKTAEPRVAALLTTPASEPRPHGRLRPVPPTPARSFTPPKPTTLPALVHLCPEPQQLQHFDADATSARLSVKLGSEDKDFVPAVASGLYQTSSSSVQQTVMAVRALGLAGRALLRPVVSPGTQRLLSTDKNSLQGLTNGDPMSRLMQTRKQNDSIYRRFAENDFTGGGSRSGRLNMEITWTAAPRVKIDVLHTTPKEEETCVNVTDVKENRKAGASAGCLEDRKGRSRLARYAGEATGKHIGRSASTIGLKSVVVKVKGCSFFRKKKKVLLSFADHSRR